MVVPILPGGKGKEAVLFWKKEPKNFYPFALLSPWQGRSQADKKFLLLFSKRSACLLRAWFQAG
jgi:hypothetical protein